MCCHVSFELFCIVSCFIGHTLGQGSEFYCDGEHANPAGQRVIVDLVKQFAQHLQAFCVCYHLWLLHVLRNHVLVDSCVSFDSLVLALSEFIEMYVKAFSVPGRCCYFRFVPPRRQWHAA